ncbi:hypothetical protein [Clostridium pasteurianum]|uniref:Uncharacterized protein n=1 Tax=Clostridium pasteurianum BC1 TaxID=86416 RepID=R4KDA9_CLOPA|nr:hypothetical protein [Clostridium pasteurianum]AGK97605.1 hypothetical protein Clopa_2766 [Clostridium pasteurianum BC1]
MIKLNKKEFAYAQNQFKHVIDKINNLHGEELKDFVDNIGGSKNVNNAIVNMDFTDINIVNKDEEINKQFINTIWEICGMWVFGEGSMTKEEVREYIDSDEYCSIYNKILEEDIQEAITKTHKKHEKMMKKLGED